jgi:uncharacterized protein (DUF2267 family)
MMVHVTRSDILADLLEPCVGRLHRLVEDLERRGGTRRRRYRAPASAAASGKPERLRSRDEFLEKVSAELQQIRPLGADDAAGAVFKVLKRHVSQGELAKVLHTLPDDIRALFPTSVTEKGART